MEPRLKYENYRTVDRWQLLGLKFFKIIVF